MFGHRPQRPGGRSSVFTVCRPATAPITAADPAAATPLLARPPRPGDRIVFEASRAPTPERAPAHTEETA